MIGIIDYGMGNLRSVQKAIEYLGGKAVVSSETAALDGCERLILPGVGSFAAGMDTLKACGLDGYVRRRVQDTPLLGVCLGMQFLLEGSEEEGYHVGLSLVSGNALRFTEGKIPHMGWDGVYDVRSALFAGIPDGTPFYFVHSYYADAAGDAVIGKTEYYREYASAINAGYAYGVQFHPEKSGEAGLALLRNFMRL